MAVSQLLTRMDMSDAENVKEAAHQLRRAENDTAKLAVWAATWGEAMAARCEEAEGWMHDPDEVEALTEEVNQAERSYHDLSSEVQTALHAIERIIEADEFPDAPANAIGEIIAKLELAL